MDLVVASHPSAVLHDTGPRHPERPERVGAVINGLEESKASLRRITAPRIERSELALVHEPSYIEAIESFCQSGGGALDMDTYASQASWEAALTAAGGVRALVDELETDGDSAGFAVTRPPGHHALAARAMGFCLFNNVAVASAYIRSRGERVAILDWDVHHGNGTQALVADDPGTLYASVHQAHFYPFEGDLDDIEKGEAKGTTVNIPLPAGTAGDVYRRAWVEVVLPILAQFEPDWVIVSAGFDAHTRDFLANFHLISADYGWMTQRLMETHPRGRTIVALEGGYDLDALRESSAAVADALVGEFEDEELPLESPVQSSAALSTVLDVVGRHWRI